MFPCPEVPPMAAWMAVDSVVTVWLPLLPATRDWAAHCLHLSGHATGHSLLNETTYLHLLHSQLNSLEVASCQVLRPGVWVGIQHGPVPFPPGPQPAYPHPYPSPALFTLSLPFPCPLGCLELLLPAPVHVVPCSGTTKQRRPSHWLA